MAIEAPSSNSISMWPDRLRHSAIILLAAGLALAVLVTFGELSPVRAAAVFVCIAATHHDDGQIVVTVLLVQARELRREFVTRAAMGIAENEQHAASTIFFQRNRAAMNVGKLE